MVTDAVCAHLCAEIYNPTDLGLWTHFDAGDDDGICWGLVRMDDCDVVVLRGSKTFQDWFRDLIALALPFSHNALGPVHPGFLLGMEHLWSELRHLVSNSIVVTGHSLGAGRASILCGLMRVDNVTVTRRVCFGEPKPGFQKLADILATVPGASYINGSAGAGGGHDLVTDVPFSFPPEEYLHPSPLVRVTAPPLKMDWGIFSWHHAELYEKALAPNG